MKRFQPFVVFRTSTKKFETLVCKICYRCDDCFKQLPKFCGVAIKDHGVFWAKNIYSAKLTLGEALFMFFISITIWSPLILLRSSFRRLFTYCCILLLPVLSLRSIFDLSGLFGNRSVYKFAFFCYDYEMELFCPFFPITRDFVSWVHPEEFQSS